MEKTDHKKWEQIDLGTMTTNESEFEEERYSVHHQRHHGPTPVPSILCVAYDSIVINVQRINRSHKKSVIGPIEPKHLTTQKTSYGVLIAELNRTLFNTSRSETVNVSPRVGS